MEILSVEKLETQHPPNFAGSWTGKLSTSMAMALNMRMLIMKGEQIIKFLVLQKMDFCIYLQIDLTNGLLILRDVWYRLVHVGV